MTYSSLTLVLAVISCGTASLSAQASQTAGPGRTGILLLAHGGRDNWNDEVTKLAAEVRQRAPIEVAFGMAARRNIQTAADRLAKSRVREIVAVPLFVSSHSSVITATEYLLGVRATAPPELAAFARMDHGHGGHEHGPAGGKPEDAARPIECSVPIRMAPALGRHPMVADILTDRALAISKKPGDEVVVLVAHGPVSDDDNQKWLSDMAAIVANMRPRVQFSRIDYLTVRDDAPEPVRSRATAELRGVVSRALAEGKRVLVVPLLISFGGIETGIRKRLEGLEYAMSPHGLLPDVRLGQWILLSAVDAKPARVLPAAARAKGELR